MFFYNLNRLNKTLYILSPRKNYCRGLHIKFKFDFCFKSILNTRKYFNNMKIIVTKRHRFAFYIN